MATVYLARDLRHDRPVALKVLRPELAAVIGAERFLAEIRTTANLQHPHILPLFDSGQADSFLFYAMPLVEGESLRQRLAREGQLSVADAIRIATEVAGALDYAHRRGVIHRDIKPENVLLHDGQALVADFGIALALSNAGGSRMTETGLSLGTPHYMSPEQAMGDRTVTARSDVYALGAITYEMLLGEPPFTGHSAQAIVARVLTEEPRRLTPQRKTVPAHVEVAVLTALQKLPADRFATAGEFASAIGSPGRVALDTAERASIPALRASPFGRGPARAAYALALLALVGLAGWQWLDRHGGSATPPPLLRASLVPPLELRLPTNWSGDFAVSPDGSRIVYVAVDRGDRARLWVQRLDESSARLLEGAEDARHPFWSPDGRSIGFFAGGELRVIPAVGGVIRALAKAPIPGGGAWGPGDLILFATEPSGVVWKVPAQGGTAEPVTVRGNRPAHYVPQFLPDGHRFLYTSANEDGVYLGDLETGRARLLRAGAKRGIFVPPDLLLYADGRLGEAYRLMAQHFDPSDASLHGEPTVIVERLFYPRGYPAFTVSETGLLAYQPFPMTVHPWQIVSRTGEVLDSVPRHGWSPRFSHGGEQVALGGADLWVHDLNRGLSQKLPSSGYVKVLPVWSPDDRRIAYWTRSPPRWREVIRLSAADGSADDSLFAFPFGSALPVDWSPDGRSLLVAGRSDSLSSRLGLWLLDLQTGAPRLWLTVDGSIGEARFSPDGKWLAYSSDETGSSEIYLRPFPGPGAARRVSVLGGTSPGWRRDGRELYYAAPGKQIMKVSVSGGVVPAPSSPRPWGIGARTAGAWEVARDGERLLLEPQGEPQPLLLIQGWTRLVSEAR
jgi:serine/threonine-protein kinase